MAAASTASAIDFRFDNVSASFEADNTSWFTAQHLPALAFPSANGHDVEMSDWSNSYNNTITTAGNSFGIYYNDYNKRFTADASAAASVSAINTFATSRFGTDAKNRWLVLNEIDAATWDGASGNAYRTWTVDTLKGLHDLGYEKIILWTPRYLASKTHAATFQTITNYAYLGLETYLDGYKIKNTHNYSLAKVQEYYQGYYDAWTSKTSGPGLDPAKLFAGEHFGVYPRNYVAGQYFGSNGISGTDWQKAIQIRSLAIRNIPFGGFIGYLWQRNLLATGDDATDLAAQLSYERAYAATMVVQSEVPTWTGNAGTTNTWSDGFNWTGGLPSLTQHPYPLLAATNPTLPKQTAANFFKTIKAATTVTLDGNQSVTRLAFDSPYKYTIAPGTGGALTLSGNGASLAVISGTHSISAGVTLASNVAANLVGNLSISGPLTNLGVTLTKSGAGTLTLAGAQNWTVGSQLVVGGGGVTFFTDAGSGGRNLALNVQNTGRVSFVSPQRLASLQIGAGATVTTNAGGANTLDTNTLTIDATGGGRLELVNNAIVVRAGTLSSILSLIKTGYNNGTWTGAGITSAAAATDPSGLTGIGYASNGDLGASSFEGATGLDGDDVLVKYTYYGDADLNGVVDPDDFNQFLAGFQDSTLPRTWVFGDFDYNNVIDPDDFNLFLAAFQANGSPLSELADSIEMSSLSAGDQQTFLNAVAAVPEPGTLGVSILTIGALSARRRNLSAKSD